MSPLRKKSELTKVFRASFVASLGVLCFKDTRESASMVKAQRAEEGGPVAQIPPPGFGAGSLPPGGVLLPRGLTLLICKMGQQW